MRTKFDIERMIGDLENSAQHLTDDGYVVEAAVRLENAKMLKWVLSYSEGDIKLYVGK